MMKSTEMDIESLVDELTPVRHLRVLDGIALTVAATIFAAVGIFVFVGEATGMAAGNIESVLVLRLIALLAVGFGAGIAVLSMSRPSAGAPSRDYWKWAVAAAGIFPLLALGQAIAEQPDMGVLAPSVGLECLSLSGISALLIGTAMVLWLRSGAPASPERAGLLVGLSAGAFGAAAYSLFCPMHSVIYIGTWYTLAVALCTLAGRIVVPPLLRW